MVNFHGVIMPPMRGNSKTIIFKGKANMFGQMEGDTKDNGSTIKCMEKGNSDGQMVKNTPVTLNKIHQGIMLKIKKKDMVFFNGVMGECMKVIGRMVNNMEKEF